MNPNLSQTPYLIRALWQWCTDAGLSPQILVHVDDMAQVPRQFVVDGRIQFLGDCTHELAGQTVDIPGWDTVLLEDEA